MAEYNVPASLAVLEDDGGDMLMRCKADDPDWLGRLLVQLEIPFTVRRPEAPGTALRRHPRSQCGRGMGAAPFGGDE